MNCHAGVVFPLYGSTTSQSKQTLTCSGSGTSGAARNTREPRGGGGFEGGDYAQKDRQRMVIL